MNWSAPASAAGGFTGLPASTTHVITPGIAGTVTGFGSSLDKGMLPRIAAVSAVTSTVTMPAAGGLFFPVSRGGH